MFLRDKDWGIGAWRVMMGAAFYQRVQRIHVMYVVCVCVWYVYTKRKIVIHHMRQNVDNGSIWVPLCPS